jgi:hypothetical protein
VFAEIYARLGDKPHTLDALEKSYEAAGLVPDLPQHHSG